MPRQIFSNTVTTTTTIHIIVNSSLMLWLYGYGLRLAVDDFSSVFALQQKQTLLRRSAWAVASSPHSVRRTWNCYTARERDWPRWTASADSVLCLLNGHHQQLAVIKFISKQQLTVQRIGVLKVRRSICFRVQSLWRSVRTIRGVVYMGAIAFSIRVVQCADVCVCKGHTIKWKKIG